LDVSVLVLLWMLELGAWSFFENEFSKDYS
jgi:hypothetical protein